LLLQITASVGEVKSSEDMQDYLARMNKQLEEMAAQHLQVTELHYLQQVLWRWPLSRL
jgi:predicted aldo/keto reductase-like oxidoreductase